MNTKWPKKALAVGGMLTLATFPAVNEPGNRLGYWWTGFNNYSTSPKEFSVIYSCWSFLAGFIKCL